VDTLRFYVTPDDAKFSKYEAIGNTFDNHVGTGTYWLGADSVGYALINKNNWMYTNAVENVTLFNEGEVDFQWNFVKSGTAGPVGIHVGNQATLRLSNNIYEAVGKGNNPLVQVASGATYYAINNIVRATGSGGETLLGFFTVLSGGTLYLDGTKFIGSGATTHAMLKANAGATVNFGVNKYAGTTVPYDTAAIGTANSWFIQSSVSVQDSASVYRKAISVADGGQIILATGVAGFGKVYCNDEYATFVFTSAGAVTLVAAAVGSTSANTSTTEDNDGTLNIFDNGSGIGIENELGARYVIMIDITYFTP